MFEIWWFSKQILKSADIYTNLQEKCLGKGKTKDLSMFYPMCQKYLKGSCKVKLKTSLKINYCKYQPDLERTTALNTVINMLEREENVTNFMFSVRIRLRLFESLVIKTEKQYR